MPHSNRRRYVAIVIVGALHVLVVDVLVHGPRSQQSPAEDDTVSSIVFFVPEVIRRPPPTDVKPKNVVPRSAPRVQAPAAESDSSISTAPGPTVTRPSVDWMSELSSVAADVAAVPALRGGPGGATPPKSGSWWAPPLHAVGEQYRLSTGELVVWVSAHCFLVSELPPLGTPNSSAHMGLTHTQCISDPGPRGDLFKDLRNRQSPSAPGTP
jgi:hypothetical protein